MDDPVVNALESAVADLGTLLVQMEKFRAARDDEARILRAGVLALGDRARRAHHEGTLDAGLARALAEEAAAARVALTGWLARTRGGPAYRAAVAALGADDRPRLAGLLAELFDDTAAVPPPAMLHHPIAWQRRGRPRPATDIAADLARLLRNGLPGDDDAEAPGIDPELPGVVLRPAPPLGDPAYVAIEGATVPSPVLALATTGDVVVPGARLRVPFRVVLAAPDDDDADADAWVLDPVAFHRDLGAALAACGVPVTGDR